MLPHWSEATHLQVAPVAAPELQEVVRLQDHVVEFEERERLLAVEPLLHRLEAEHPIDREVPAVLAQERDVVKGVEPVRIVDHQGGVPLEVEEALEDAPDAGDVGGYVFVGEQLPALVLAGRVADLGGAASHEDDGTMTGALHVPEQHDRDEASDMQRIGRRVEPDVARNPAGSGGGVQRPEVGALVEVAALDERAQELGANGCRRRGVVPANRCGRFADSRSHAYGDPAAPPGICAAARARRESTSFPDRAVFAGGARCPRPPVPNIHPLV